MPLEDVYILIKRSKHGGQTVEEFVSYIYVIVFGEY